ncbi:PIN domain-containing protein [Streptomyces sp. NPDC059802]|uniref:PIN domain-containing protein n=1 Tax=Streptomyces sp. NPDC059802 TaxID=3346952 RepID=UPI003651D008
MLITLAPGAHRDNAIDALRSVSAAAVRVRGSGPHDAFARLTAYLGWSNDAARQLHNQISPADIDRLVLTRRHQALFDGFGHLAGTAQQGVVNGMVDLELAQRVADLKEAINVLEGQKAKWDGGTTAFLVPDTNFYIHHPAKLKEIDFTTTFPDLGPREIRLVFPMAVVDELDNLKQSKDRQTRWRAGYTLAVLDDVIHGTGPAVMTRKGYAPPSYDGLAFDVSLEIVFDPPAHTRLPITDDEIVSRTVALEALVAAPVTLLTYDTAMSMRARMAGLKTMKFRTDAGEGPEPAEK